MANGNTGMHLERLGDSGQRLCTGYTHLPYMVERDNATNCQSHDWQTMRSTPSAALEVLLMLPPLEIHIKKESRHTD
jgi:hypothetical protein